MRYFRPGFICRPPIVTVWNQQDKTDNVTLSGGLLVATANASAVGGVRSTVARTTGKNYAELIMGTTGEYGLGLSNNTNTFAAVGANAAGAMIQFSGLGGPVYKNGSLLFSNGNLNAGGLIRVAYDADNHLAWLALNGGNWNASGAANPATGVGGQSTSAFDTNGLYLCYMVSTSGSNGTLNAGGTSFTYGAPSGFSPWNG